MRVQNFREPLDRFLVTPVTVPPQAELRVLHSFARNVFIRLTDGAAEIAGCELGFAYYALPTRLKSLGIYSHPGCRLELLCEADGPPIRHYLQPDEDGYFGQLFAFNALLEAHRRHAFAQLIPGPKVLVLGSESAGKLTLIRTLVNYAVKNEWKPVLADLDPLDSKLTAFGAISATVVSEFLPQGLAELGKLAFFFGYDSLKDRFELYAKQVRTLCGQIAAKTEAEIDRFKLALVGGVFLEGEHQAEYQEALRERLERGQREAEGAPPRFVIARVGAEGGREAASAPTLAAQASEALVRRVLRQDPELGGRGAVRLVNDYIDKETFASGVFLNPPNELSSLKPTEIQELIDLVAPDYVVVIAHDHLRFQVQTAIAGKSITLVRFPKSGGATMLDSEERSELRAAQVQSYFNSELLMCVRDTLATSDLAVFQIESAANSPLKYIKAVSDRALILKKIDFSTVQLKGMFLGLVNLPASDRVEVDDILGAELLALLYVMDFDDRFVTLKRPEGLPEHYHRLVMCLGNLGV